MSPFAEVYNRPEIASHYLTSVLQPAEALLLQAVMARAGKMDMLDLGVGAGRTSFFFLPFVCSYVGVDLAPRMIDLCRERFADFRGAAGVDLRIGDAAALTSCADAVFDAVLFSCNGIDCLSIERRAHCLSEVHRVLRPGGLFLFSAHNLQSLEACFGASSSLDATRLAAIRRFNEAFAEFRAKDAALFWDGVYGDDGALKHVYVKPRAQRFALERQGFGSIRVISSETGLDLAEDQIDESVELTLHFWCVKPGVAPL